jgi:succinate dehydrogenase / fumarate reductase cytochrome b subunit
MAASIIHRATGVALSIGGLTLLTWWLFAISAGSEEYANFTKLATSPIGLIVLIGISWSFFQHLLTGIRHLVMDTGAAFELGVNKTSAVLTFVGAVLLTAVLWFYLLGVAK